MGTLMCVLVVCSRAFHMNQWLLFSKGTNYYVEGYVCSVANVFIILVYFSENSSKTQNKYLFYIQSNESAVSPINQSVDH